NFAMLVLGIETSCDETCAAIVDDTGRIIAESMTSQIKDHQPFGGVVPEIAARRHLDCLDDHIRTCLDKAGCQWGNIAAIAATAGPGLIGGIAVGVMTAKSLAFARDLPFLAINHLEGHALSPMLGGNIAYPYLLLLVSGGHCQFVLCHGLGRYAVLGGTRDDAAGEAFDKAARLLGLPYPGGPAIEQAARGGDATKIDLPISMLGHAGCDMSFSGLKSALDRHVKRHSALKVEDCAAAFQHAVVSQLCERAQNAIIMSRETAPSCHHFAVAGGVAANAVLRASLAALTKEYHWNFVVPDQKLCTDNAAMIAWAGLLRARAGQCNGLDFAPRPRWPLQENS
ncbi:MAG: tRNA (adenosine(37)-N6)-threonylcarbamoyltransferase complex transferase subunit TsaD, partial [Pseudomonadota bacterium]